MVNRLIYFEKYYELILLAGDVSPSNYAMILYDYNKIDFSKKEERLVLIINLLRTGEVIKNDNIKGRKKREKIEISLE